MVAGVYVLEGVLYLELDVHVRSDHVGGVLGLLGVVVFHPGHQGVVVHYVADGRGDDSFVGRYVVPEEHER